jgi:hypothetical protein
MDPGGRTIALRTRPAALVLLYVLNLGDALTTKWVLALGGHESNPFAAQLLDRSMNDLVIVKLLIVTAIVFAAVFSPPAAAARSARWVWWAVIIYALVVTWNCSQLLIHQFG